ncbi:TPA: hypothetical protein DEP21_03845 [Patescibacteria group bacterium]|nr:hypothetical protein [Candidatus Gracilibacteria bacterium]
MNLIRNEDEFKKGNHILSLKKFAAFVERSTLDNVDYTKLDAKYNQDIGQIVSKYKAQQESEKFNKKEAMTAQLADVELDEALQ